MCNFFSFVTDPVNHPAEYYYFGWDYREAHSGDDDADSHSHICAFYKLDEDRCNKYEYNPLTGRLIPDMMNSEKNDSEAAFKWVRRLDFKEVVEPLIMKIIVSPLELRKVESPTEEQIDWLKEWVSTRNLIRESSTIWSLAMQATDRLVGHSVGRIVRFSVENLVWNSFGHPVQVRLGADIPDPIGDSFQVYVSSFINADYGYDFSPAMKLMESGLLPSFDGTTWRLHSGKSADIVYEWIPEKESKK